MSTTVTNLQAAGCGCDTPQTVEDDNLTIVPGGSRIVETPCADACTPPSSAAAAVVQQPGTPAANCESYANSCLLLSLQMVALEKTATMNAVCASSWALPGLELFFPGLGYVEVVGATGDIITYKNLTIEPDTQILAGTCFHHDAPGRAAEGGEGGLPNPEDVDATNTLDGIYGFENGVGKKILPVDNVAIVGCGGKWLKRQLGQMRYPLVPRPQILDFTGSAIDRTWDLVLPSLPTLPDCNAGFGIELGLSLDLDNPSGTGPQIFIRDADDQEITQAFSRDSKDTQDTNTVTLPLAVAATTVFLRSVHNNAGTGTMHFQVWAQAYHY